MIDERKDKLGEQSEEQVNIQELLFRYLIHWPWFVVSIIICIACAWGYLRLTTPIYNISATVLIKDEKKGGGASMSSDLEKMGLEGFISSSSNVDNEIEVLRSKSLAREVVNNLGLFVTYMDEDEFPSKELYHTSPVLVSLTHQEADKLPGRMEINMILQPTGVLGVQITVGEKEYRKQFDKLPAVFPTDEGTVAFFANNDTLSAVCPENITKERHITAFINRPFSVLKEYVSSLSIAPTSKNTSVAVLSLKNPNTRRGKDFINKLLEMYNINANNDKNEVAQKSAEFIEERIGIINRELGTTESELADFKQRSGLTDLTSDAQLALQENSRYEQQRTENATQISLVTYLHDYINNPKNLDEVIPANVGLKDANLASIIEQYNTMLIERKRLLRTSSENNPAIINMNTGIEAMRYNVQTTVNSVLKGLQITRDDIDRQARKFEGRISNAPLQEKEFMTISRQQEIKAALYIMLLQKREENAITLAATANNGRIIEEPLPGKYPVSPRKKVFMLAALMLGLGIPVGIIYLNDLLKYKIENREDVEKITNVAVLGEIPLGAKPEEGAIVVRENRNDMMEETFRALRTNMLFMLGSDEKVILFSSSQPGEGKSFIAGNTAVSLAYMGKKVIIVGMDIRKPGLNKVFNMSRRAEGITNYLSDPKHSNLFDLIQRSDISPNLDILPGGLIPPNPTELVASDALDKAIEQLKEHYDYVILDTAPIGLVTDTAIIGRVADLCVYVCRADVTPKAAFGYINTLRDEKKFSKLATVINSIDMSKRKNSYGYGYGKKYGYGYGKRYGYGYGYGYETNEKKKSEGK